MLSHFKLLARSDSFFLTPRMPYELNNAIGAPVCFMEGMVRFKGKWLLYYEAGDHVGAMAVCDKPGFETKKQKSLSIFRMGHINITVLCGLIWLCFTLNAVAAPADPLESGFLNPPDSAKPQTWWHWMNGNITKAGITADLEAMKQIGLGGATIVNPDSGIPPGPVEFMSPEWREYFKFAIAEANRLGLEMCVGNCAG